MKRKATTFIVPAAKTTRTDDVSDTPTSSSLPIPSLLRSDSANSSVSYDNDVRKSQPSRQHGQRLSTPADPKGNRALSLANIKVQIISADEVRYTFAQKRYIRLAGYSHGGVQEGRTSRKLFLRLEPLSKTNKSLYEGLEEIDAFTNEAYTLLQEMLFDDWKIKRPVVFVPGGGLQASLTEMEQGTTPELTLCVFPGQYSQGFTLDEKRSPDRYPSIISHFHASTGNSNFIAKLVVSAIKFTYHPKQNEIHGFAHVNVDELTFIQEGQDTSVNKEKEKAEKARLEKLEAAEVRAMYVAMLKEKTV